MKEYPICDIIIIIDFSPNVLFTQNEMQGEHLGCQIDFQ